MNLSDALHIVIELADQNVLDEWDSKDTELTKEVRRQEQAIRVVRKLMGLL